MIPSFSKRLLFNLAVAVAVVGASIYVAWSQVSMQRETEARLARAALVRQDIDSLRDALGAGLGVLERIQASGVPELPTAHVFRLAVLDATVRSARTALGDDPELAGRLDAALGEAFAVEHDIDATIAGAGRRFADERASGAKIVPAPAGLDATAWAAGEYARLEARIDRVDAQLAALQSAQDLVLANALGKSRRSANRVLTLLIATIFAAAALLLYVFGAHAAREELRRRRFPGERFRGVFDAYPDQIKAEAEAQRSNQMLEMVLDNIPQRIFWKDVQSRYLGCNMAFARDAGLAYPEQIIGKTDSDLPWRDYADSMRAQDREVTESGLPKIDFEDELMIHGRRRTMLKSKLPLLDGEGCVIGVLGSMTITTERKRADLTLRLQSRALDACVNAILITSSEPDGNNVIEYANPAFRRITGYDPAEVIGRDSRFLQCDDRDQDGLVAIRQALLENREVSAVLRNYRKDGVLFWSQLLIAPVPDVDGRTTHHIGVINDITELIHYQEQLEYQANYDSLTMLPNRNLLRDRLQQAIVSGQRKERGVAVVFVDLDGFKNVNDSLGHSAGDQLLGVVAERLGRCTRASETVARHGGDEFVILLTDLVDDQALIAWMERVRAVISEPVWVDGTELFVGCSMGVSVYPQDGEDAETLLKRADVAMYRAKDMGRNTFQFFRPEMNANAGTRMNLERRLRRALRDGEFRLHYQPQIDLETERIVGVEALVRWHDPELGLVPPAQFIPVAEESGLVAPLSDWVLREACRQNRAWQQAGLPSVRVAVNLSARVFQLCNIAGLVMEVLAQTGLDAHYLELELTESTLMRNAEEVVSMLDALHALGVGLAVDDFGTGYSSLSYLKKLPVDRLKIDRSFVDDIGTSDDDETITAAIIALAHELQLQVIAEGVETSTQLNFLRERACDEIQGFLFSPPLPGDEIASLLCEGISCMRTALASGPGATIGPSSRIQQG